MWGSAGPQDQSRSPVTTTMATLSLVIVSIAGSATGQANVFAAEAPAGLAAGRLLRRVGKPTDNPLALLGPRHQ